MASPRRNRRLARRFAARHAGRRARNRLHRHQTVLAPQPWGAIELPITFSAGAYEQQSDWFYERTGVGSFVGGPICGWCDCGAADPRLAVARRQVATGGASYWQVPLSDETAAAMRAAEEAQLAQWIAENKVRRAARKAARARGEVVESDFLADLFDSIDEESEHAEAETTT